MKNDPHADSVTRPKEEPDPVDKEGMVDEGRRGLLRTMFGSAMGLGFVALGSCGALWAAATGRFLLPNTLAEAASKFKIGFPNDYAPDRVEGRFSEKHGVWIVNAEYRGQRQIFALRTTCTHLGCIVIWQQGQQKFKCPCHGSGFYPNGLNVEGPAPRPLERYAIRLAEDGQLEVDKSATFQEELGQWRDTASYVLA